MLAPTLDPSLFRPRGPDIIVGTRGPLVNSRGSVLLASGPVTYEVLRLGHPTIPAAAMHDEPGQREGAVTLSGAPVPVPSSIGWSGAGPAPEPPTGIASSVGSSYTTAAAYGHAAYPADTPEADVDAAKRSAMPWLRGQALGLAANLTARGCPSLRDITEGRAGHRQGGTLTASLDLSASASVDYTEGRASASVVGYCAQEAGAAVVGYFGRRGASVRFTMSLMWRITNWGSRRAPEFLLTLYKGQGGMTAEDVDGPMPSWTPVDAWPITPATPDGTEGTLSDAVLLDGSTPYLLTLETVPEASPPVAENVTACSASVVNKYTVTAAATFEPAPSQAPAV